MGQSIINIMQIENININLIKDHPGNIRNHPAKQIRLLKKSIQECGFRFPVHLNEDKVLIAGHARVEAAKQLGFSEIPAVIHTDLSEQQERALRIADNRLAELSEWNMDSLKSEMDILSAEFQEIVGFNLSDLEFNSLEEVKPETEKIDLTNNPKPKTIKVCPKCGHQWE